MKAKFTQEWNALLDPFASEAKWLPAAMAVDRLGLALPDSTISHSNRKREKLHIAVLLAFLFLFLATNIIRQIGSVVYTGYGYSLKEQRLWTKSVEAFNIAIWLSDARDASLYFSRANCESEIGDHKSAIRDYTRSIAYDPSDACSYNNRAIAYANIGQNDLALADYDQSVLLFPKHAEHFIGRAELLKDRGRLNEALNDFSTAATLAGEDIKDTQSTRHAFNYNFRARALYELGMYDQALPDAQEAIRLDPNNVDFLFIRAKIFSAQHNLLSAIKDFNIYASKNSKDPDVFLELAKANEELGNPAIATFQRSKAAMLKQQSKLST
jgi:tetratricopeptide (TPR) repeat protein